MRRTSLIVAVIVAVIATSAAMAAPAAVVGEPTAQPHSRPVVPTASSLVVTESRTVPLITGDTVRVLTRADGSTATAIVSGPHAGGPVVRWGSADSSYLMPRLARPLRSKLDASLFDVARLARLPGGPVPIVVELDRAASGSARRAVSDALHATAGSDRLLRGTYRSGFAGLGAADLEAVRTIRLAAAPQPPAPVDGPRHTLTVDVRRGAGHADWARVLIENLDDTERYLETPAIDEDGTLSVQVPEGNYAVLAWTFARLVAAPELSVRDDTTVTLDLADATVRPHVSMPGHRVVDTVLSVGRTPEEGFSFPLQFSGPRFFMRVQPAAADVTHGSLHTGVSAKLVPDGAPGDRPRQIAVTADVADGIPADLTYAHRRADFARVVQRFNGNGPAGSRLSWIDAGAPGVDFWTGSRFEAPVPGRRELLLQASPDLYYQQTLLPQAARSDSDDLTQLTTVAQYRTAGRNHRVTFAHGPVGPGVEGPGVFGGARRVGDRLNLSFPLFSGAGSGMSGWVDRSDGWWELRQEGRLLDRGHGSVYAGVDLPRGRRTYELRAVSRPTSETWTLSTRVEDAWRFHSSRGTATPPILMPSYVPRTSLAGRLRPGPTGFELSFRTPPRDPRIARARVELSTDGGRNWRPARVVRTGPAAFDVRYRNPAAGTGRRTMSLRVSGRDGHGNAVRETAIDVYRLR